MATATNFAPGLMFFRNEKNEVFPILTLLSEVGHAGQPARALDFLKHRRKYVFGGPEDYSQD